MQQPKKQVEVITKDTIKRIFASINTRTLIGKRILPCSIFYIVPEQE